MIPPDEIECPACGGGGGGPFGPAGSAWDDASYVCPRCEGIGYVSAAVARARAIVARPSLAKVPAERAAAKAEPAPKKRRASG